MELNRVSWRLYFFGVLFLGAAFPAATPVWAEAIYRCATDVGWVFQHSRCAAGAGGRFELSPENRVGSPLRPSERRYVRERVEAGARGSPNLGSIGPRGHSTRTASERTCLNKRQALERTRRRLRQGYPPAQGERLRRRRDDLDEYLRRFCE